MRKCGKQPEFLDKKGKLLGICLPADYCAEHEWGIEKLKECFGIPTFEKDQGPVGLEDRKATKVPNKERAQYSYEDLLYQENSKVAALTVGFHIYRFKPEDEKKTLLECIPSELKARPELDECLNGAWDEGSFGILAKGKKNIENLRKLRDAIEAQNVAIFLGGGGVFENPGLVIALYDVFPHEHKAAMKKADEDRIKLVAAAKATGIEKKIRENLKSSYGGHPFFALSPRWANGNEQKETKHKVVFWLNPTDQDRNNFGWFTVEQLEQWIEGKGPIPMKGK